MKQWTREAQEGLREEGTMGEKGVKGVRIAKRLESGRIVQEDKLRITQHILALFILK